MENSAHMKQGMVFISYKESHVSCQATSVISLLRSQVLSDQLVLICAGPSCAALELVGPRHKLAADSARIVPTLNHVF